MLADLNVRQPIMKLRRVDVRFNADHIVRVGKRLAVLVNGGWVAFDACPHLGAVEWNIWLLLGGKFLEDGEGLLSFLGVKVERSDQKYLTYCLVCCTASGHWKVEIQQCK